jgi:hypothetical protein
MFWHLSQFLLPVLHLPTVIGLRPRVPRFLFKQPLPLLPVLHDYICCQLSVSGHGYVIELESPYARLTALLNSKRNKLRLTLTLLTIDWASATGGCREYSARRGNNDETNVDLSCCAS